MQSSDNPLEHLFHADLCRYLLSLGRIDSHFPEAPDIEDLWPSVAQSYLPDGIREFADFPIVSLAWPAYVGMAVAKYWDTDWNLYSKVDDIYLYLRNQRDFDHLDDYISCNVLLLKADKQQRLYDVMGECAARVLSILRHAHLEPGTREAFNGYVTAIHQMYLMGMAMQLKDMGYRMEKMG